MGHQHQKQIKKSETAFAICLIRDESLLDGFGVILVHNISDADMRKRRGDNLGPLALKADKHNKPSGWGLPGGGVKTADLERPDESVVEELQEEAGLEKKPGTSPVPLVEFHRLGFVDRRTGDIVRFSQFFKKGEMPTFYVSPKEERTTEKVVNAVYVFKVEAAWEGSQLQRRLRRVKKQILKLKPVDGGMTEEEIQRDGVWFYFDELSPEAVDALGIEGRDEIDGVGIAPIEIFMPGRTAADFPSWDGGRIYTSHFMFVQKGLQELGLIPGPEPATPESAA